MPFVLLAAAGFAAFDFTDDLEAAVFALPVFPDTPVFFFVEEVVFARLFLGLLSFTEETVESDFADLVFDDEFFLPLFALLALMPFPLLVPTPPASPFPASAAFQ